MIEVLTDPVGTMRSIAARPEFLVAMIVVTVLSIVSIWLIVPRIEFGPEMRAQMAKQGIPAAQVESQLAMIERVQRFVMPVMAGLAPVWLAVIAGIIFGAFKIMGGEGNYHQAISVTTYAWMPFVIQGLIMTGLVLAGDPIGPSQLGSVVPSHPGVLINPLENPPLFALLSSLDLFTFWVMGLLAIGFSFVSGFSRGKSVAIVLSMWVVLVLIKTGLSLLQS